MIVALDMIQLETFTAHKKPFAGGRCPINRDTMVRAFISQSILGIPSTAALIDRLKVDKVLRRLCGFECKIPCEATFSNAFLEFAEHGLTAKIHYFLMSEMYADRLVGHISRDATAIESPEKVARATDESHAKIVGPFKRARPKKDEIRPAKERGRIEKS